MAVRLTATLQPRQALGATIKPQQFGATLATPGPPGPQGPPGPSSSVFFFKADANSTAQNDPGAGKIRWNTDGQLDATALYVDVLTADGFDVTALFQAMHPPQEFVIQDKDLSQKFQTWSMTAPVILYPDWFEVPVALVASGGPGSSVFSQNTNLAVLLITTIPALKVRLGHTWGLVGDVSALTALPSIFVPLIAPQVTTLYGIRTKIRSGTSVGLQMQRNGSNIGGPITVTTTAVTTMLGGVVLADGDELTPIRSSPVGAPTDFSATLILEQAS